MHFVNDMDNKCKETLVFTNPNAGALFDSEFDCVILQS